MKIASGITFTKEKRAHIISMKEINLDTIKGKLCKRPLAYRDKLQGYCSGKWQKTSNEHHIVKYCEITVYLL